MAGQTRPGRQRIITQTAPRGGAVLPSTQISKHLRVQEIQSNVFGDDIDVNEVTQILGKLRILTYPGPRWRPPHLQTNRQLILPPGGTGQPINPRTNQRPGPNRDQHPPTIEEEALEAFDAIQYEDTPHNEGRPLARGNVREAGNRDSTGSLEDEDITSVGAVNDGTGGPRPHTGARTKKKKQKRDPTGALPRSIMRPRVKPSIVGSSHIFDRLKPDFLNRAEVVLGHVTFGRNSHKNVEKRINKFYGSERGLPKGFDPPPENPTVGNQSAVSLDQAGDLLCDCCYIELSGTDVIQCPEGHLFCLQCLHSYAQEVVYGQARPPLWCMTDGCEETFSHSEIKKALSLEELVNYEERLQEEAVLMAGLLSDLVRCPKCNFPALPDPGEQCFRCPSAACGHESCVTCGEDWSGHEGLTCDEVEKKDETQVRLTYEELMTRAAVRMCYRCRAKFTKEDGCNHMKCRCGAIMCYLCRKPNIDYNHFCSHMHVPGKGCTKCKKCCLWTNPDQDERRAIEELKGEAQNERLRKGFMGQKLIGVPSSTAP